MNSVTRVFEVGAEALGYVGLVASWRRPISANYNPMVIIYSTADTDEGAYIPAQSVTINSREGLLALRKVIDEALKEVA